MKTKATHADLAGSRYLALQRLAREQGKPAAVLVEGNSNKRKLRIFLLPNNRITHLIRLRARSQAVLACTDSLRVGKTSRLARYRN